MLSASAFKQSKWWAADPSVNLALRSFVSPVLSLYLAWSLMATIGLVDLWLASYLGKDAQAALGAGDQILFLTMLAASGLAAGVNTTMSQAFGAGDSKLARTYMKAGLFLTLIFGSAATLAGLALARPLAKLFCADANAALQASQYIRLCALANLPWMIIQCQGAILRALGQASLIAQQWLFITLIAVIPGSLCFFLLPGQKTLAPVALAWVLASLAGLWFGETRLKALLPAKDDGDISSQEMIKRSGEILAVGLPVLFGEFSWLLSNLLLFCLLAKLPDGATAQAAWTIKLKLEETAAYAPLLATSMATATLIGRKVGALEDEQAKHLAYQLTHITTLIMLVVGLATASLAALVLPLLTGDVQTARLAQLFLLSAVVSYPLNAICNVLASAFEGSGKTFLPMLINFCGFFLLRLPLAWALMDPLGGGAFGVLAGKVISSAFAAGGMVCIYRMTPWFKRQQSTH